MKTIRRIAALALTLFALVGCAAEMEPAGPEGATADLTRICPAIAILCVEGYQPKQLPNCDQICVPTQDVECRTDLDCGPIYCITEPCDQPVCRGRKCVLATPGNGGGNEGAGEPCGDIHCGAGSYCCNDSCGICAPDGGACIQIACAEL